MSLFDAPSEQALDEVLERMERRTVDAGERFIRQGDRGDAFFLVLSGELHVVDDRIWGEPVTLATKGPGEIVGEISLQTGEARTASVYR